MKPEQNYKETLSSIQRKLPAGSRHFSKIIHSPSVETTCKTLEKTLMRPSVLMGITWTALATGLIFYFSGNYYGFTISGTEMLLAMLGGAIIGLVLEAIWILIRKS